MTDPEPPPIPLEIAAGGPAPVSATRRIALGAGEVIRHALLGAVPVVGGALDAAVSEVERQRKEAGRDELLRQLARFADRLDEKKLDLAYLDSDEFKDRFATAWRLAEKTRDTTRIRLYAAILAGSASGMHASDLEPDSILQVLADLSPDDLLVLQDVWRKGQSGHMAYTYRRADEEPKLPEHASRHLVFHLLRLERAGLIKQEADVHDALTGDAFAPTMTLFTLMELVRELDTEEPRL